MREWQEVQEMSRHRVSEAVPQAGWIRSRLIQPLKNLLKAGLTPSELAKSLAAGVVIACFPILGTTTLLCALLAPFFRWNPIAIQVGNYAAYPLQFLLLIPFYSAGNRLFGEPPIPLSAEQLTKLFQADFWGATRAFAATGARGTVAWLLVAGPTYWVLGRLGAWIAEKAWSKRTSERPPLS